MIKRLFKTEVIQHFLPWTWRY